MSIDSDSFVCGWIPRHMRISGSRSSAATAGGVNVAERCRTWKSIINNFAATPEKILREI